ncbi:glycosyltransferase family 4 protein [Winogradskyella rapida]|uniref:Glycosyltransferase family 4 protein n=1 Tax=Winogradskyella rapida TaxID=549701 RepID=A0ABW3KUS4_9FLAO
MNNNKRVVILFSRLSDYMLKTLETYVATTKNEILIFKIDPDKTEAPFQFNLKNDLISFKNENDFNESELLTEIETFDPNVIICSGWWNKKYINVVKHLHKSTPCILTMDNQWHGTLKQYLGCVYGRLFLKKLFVKIWVPGNAQKEFAKKLGFLDEDILTGWYVANDKFSRQLDEDNFNKRFVFVGRYVAHKGILDLINCFKILKESTNDQWQLHCYGTGDLIDKLPIDSDIIHHGFMQPSQLVAEAKKGGVFVLPSHFEPWGLVVQEFALAGYPLIVSNKVGAAEQFVKKDNGLIFEAKENNSLLNALRAFTLKSDIELLNMSKKSQEYGKTIGTKSWTANLESLIKSFDN